MIKWSQKPEAFPREITFEDFLGDAYISNGNCLGEWSPYFNSSNIQRMLPSLKGVKSYDYYLIVDTPYELEYQIGEEIVFLKNGDHLVAAYNPSGELVWTIIKIVDHISSF